jgi:hypothetical protein
MYTRQHALDDNLFLAPGEGDKVPDDTVATRMSAVPAVI